MYFATQVVSQTPAAQRKRLGKSLLEMLPAMSNNNEGSASCASCRVLRAKALELNMAAQFAAASTRSWNDEANEAKHMQQVQDRAYDAQTRMAEDLRAQLLRLNTHVVEQQADVFCLSAAAPPYPPPPPPVFPLALPPP